MTKISIIIPTLNEESSISRLLKYLVINSDEQHIADIIVVDGGSEDKTVDLVETFEDVVLLHGEKGRAKQMNYGAKHAKGEVLYFLHADSFPPKHFDRYILNEVQRANRAGCFRMSFNSNHWWLRLAGWLTQFQWRACRGGDQSQFITATLFHELGGYDENYVIYEDNALISRLYAIDEFVVIQKTLTTSARCYDKHGVCRLQYHFWTIHLKHSLGASAEELHRYYQKHVMR